MGLACNYLQKELYFVFMLWEKEGNDDDINENKGDS